MGLRDQWSLWTSGWSIQFHSMFIRPLCQYLAKKASNVLALQAIKSNRFNLLHDRSKLKYSVLHKKITIYINLQITISTPHLNGPIGSKIYGAMAQASHDPRSARAASDLGSLRSWCSSREERWNSRTEGGNNSCHDCMCILYRGTPRPAYMYTSV